MSAQQAASTRGPQAAATTAASGAAGAGSAAIGRGAEAARGRTSSRAAQFLRSSAFDYLLVLAVSVGLVFTVSYGFDSAPVLRGNGVLETVVCALLLAVLYAGSWSKRAIVPAAVGYVVASAVVIGVLVAAMPAGTAVFSGGVIDDAADNYVVFGLVLVVVPAVVYLLSRRPVGMVVLVFAAVIALGTIQFLYRDWISSQPGTAVAFLVYAALAALFVNRAYRRSVYTAHRVRKTSFGSVFGYSVAISLVCLGVGCAVFYGIIAGLGLTTPEIKPFQDYYSKPVVEYTGVYDEQQLDNPDITTNQTNDNQQDSNQDAEGGTTAGTDDQENSGQQMSAVAKAVSALNLDDWTEQFETVSYQTGIPLWVFTLAAVVAAVVAIVLAWRSRRTRRLKRIASWKPADQVRYLYDFVVGRFRRLRVERASSLTPLEFAFASRSILEPYARNMRHVDFVRATLAYQRAVYGKDAVTEDDVEDLVSYYHGLFKNAREQVGWLRWVFWYFWRI